MHVTLESNVWRFFRTKFDHALADQFELVSGSVNFFDTAFEDDSITSTQCTSLMRMVTTQGGGATCRDRRTLSFE